MFAWLFNWILSYKVRVFLTCVSSEHSAFKGEVWDVSKDIRVRSVPQLATYLQFSEPFLTNGHIVKRVEHILYGHSKRVIRIHVYLEGTINPHTAGELTKRFGWFREPYAR
ncbi:MAG: hypothetical protein AAB472_02450 [Patescibacteria group bacterium]